jgi:SAM-dependent methyltransferase
MAKFIHDFPDGAAYERFMGQWSRAAGEIFLDWLTLPEGLRWLDAGCGTGVFTELVRASQVPAEIVAIDPSGPQIAYAQNQPVGRRASFLVGDAQGLPFGDDEFDVVASALVINFIPDRLRAIAEMRRVARPGGTVAGYIWDFFGGRDLSSPFVGAFADMGLKRPAPSGIEDSRLEALQAMFEKAGLSDVAVQAIDIEIAFSDFDDFWDSNLGFPTPTAKTFDDLSKPQRQRFKDIMREKVPTDARGRIAYSARANAVKGRVPSRPY